MFPLCPLLPAALTFLVHGILSTTTVWFFKACPLPALLWQEITWEGGRRVAEGCMGFVEAIVVIHWESFHHPECRTHHQPGTACVWDWQFLRFPTFKIHFVPPSSHSLLGHPLVPTLSDFVSKQTKELPLRSKSKLYHYYFFNAETG